MSKNARGRRQAARQRAVQKEARSRAQAEASRINGAKSRGPVSVEGKTRSSQNALRHGLMATRLVMTEEERAWAEERRRDLALRFDPYDTVEMDAIDTIVVVQIKLHRLDQLEGEAISRFVNKDGTINPELVEPSTIKSELVEPSTGEPARRRFPSLDTIGRYRNRLMKEWHEAQARLALLARQRPAFPPERPDHEANENDPQPAATLEHDASRKYEPDTPVTPPPNSLRELEGAGAPPQRKSA